jgi:hypothetical protein
MAISGNAVTIICFYYWNSVFAKKQEGQYNCYTVRRKALHIYIFHGYFTQPSVLTFSPSSISDTRNTTHFILLMNHLIIHFNTRHTGMYSDCFMPWSEDMTTIMHFLWSLGTCGYCTLGTMWDTWRERNWKHKIIQIIYKHLQHPNEHPPPYTSKLSSVALVGKLTIPTERPPLVG